MSPRGAYRTLDERHHHMQSKGAPEGAALRTWIAAGYETDVIALERRFPRGTPVALGCVAFVMRGGRVTRTTRRGLRVGETVMR